LNILIIGAGISGISCAEYLINQNMGYKISLIEKNAEVGYPQTKPGLIIDKALINHLDKKINLGETGCRRPWVSKSLAQHLARKGIQIHLRSNLIQNPTLSIKGAGRIIYLKEFNFIINTTHTYFDFKSKNIQYKPPQNKMNFKGGLTFESTNTHQPIIKVKHSDNLIECWYEDSIPEIENGWLERINGSFTLETASIDYSFEKGRKLAKEAILMMSESSQQIA